MFWEYSLHWVAELIMRGYNYVKFNEAKKAIVKF